MNDDDQWKFSLKYVALSAKFIHTINKCVKLKNSKLMCIQMTKFKVAAQDLKCFTYKWRPCLSKAFMFE